MPRIEHRLIPPETAPMFAHYLPCLPKLDPIGVGAHLYWPPDPACRHRIAIVIKADQAGLRYRRSDRMKSVEATRIRHEKAPLGLEHLPDRPIAQFRMPVRPRISNTLIKQPQIQFVVALHPQPRREEPLAYQAHLVLDLPLLPPRCRRAGNRLNQIMAAHLQKAAVVSALAADEDRVNRSLHVVVDPACAGALEQRKSPIVRVEHHLLGLARIRPHEQHSAVAL